jgi:hypothetical protein
MKTTLVALWVGLTALAFPQSTLAQSKAGEDIDSANAAARFQIAVDLYHEGSYEGALAEFKKAYQLSPSYRVLYNIAQAQYALHDFVAAYKSLIQYRNEGGDDIPADRRDQVAELLAKLRERIAHLEITTNMIGAEVRIDEVTVGSSPLPGPIPVNVGQRKISVVKAGLPIAARTVTVAGKESTKVDIHIEPPAAGALAASAKATGNAGITSASLNAKAQTPASRSRLPLILSLSATGALGIATGVVGYLALSAQNDLKNQINTYPNTKDQIDSARTRSKNYGYAADALGAATIISAAASVYFLLSHRNDQRESGGKKQGGSVVVAPTLDGMMVQGSF